MAGLDTGRLIWFVGFTGPGMREYSSGPPGAPRHMGHEDVVIIDAMSGEIVLGMTCCVIHKAGLLPPETCIQPDGHGPSFSCEEALQLAAESARQSRPEMEIQQTRIDALTAELMAYGEAGRRLAGRRGYRSTPGRDPNELVWFVTVAGEFQYEGMAAAGVPQRPTYQARERDYLIGAQTGREIEAITPDTIPIGTDAPPAWPSPPAANP